MGESSIQDRPDRGTAGGGIKFSWRNALRMVANLPADVLMTTGTRALGRASLGPLSGPASRMRNVFIPSVERYVKRFDTTGYEA